MALIDRSFIETLLVAFDDSIDISEGSPADRYIISPLLERLQEDPLKVDFEELAKSILRTRFPDLAGSDGGAIFDLLVKPLSVILEPFWAALQVIAQNQSLLNADQMSRDEVDALLANFFYSRPEQQYATGTVRIYYTQPLSVEVGDGVVFYTSDGLRFVPQYTQSISSAEMAVQKQGDLYYFDVEVVAEKPGDEYNVGVGEITRMTGLAQAVKVTNPQVMSGGTARVDNLDAVQAARDSISQRSLVTYQGIVTVIRELVSGLRAIDVIGYGDPEMRRDIIIGGSAGLPVAWGADALLVDDGGGDGKTSKVVFSQTNISDYIGSSTGGETWIISINGDDHQITQVVDDHTVLIEDRVDMDINRQAVATGIDLVSYLNEAYVYSPTTEFTTTPIIAGMILRINSGSVVDGYYRILKVGYGSDIYANHRLLLDQQLAAAVTNLHWEVLFGHLWYLRRRRLRFTDTDENELHEGSDLVHIGGKADIYVAGHQLDERSATLESVSDQRPVVFGSDLERDASVANKVTSSSVSFSDVDPGDVLHIYTGPAAGIYTVVKGDDSSLWLDQDLPSFTGAAFRVSDELDIQLDEPKDILWRGNDLLMSTGSKAARSLDGVNFSDLGVTAGCQLKVTSGQNQGIYEIVSVTGSGSHILGLSTAALYSESRLSYEVYRPLEEVVRPVVTIKSVEYQDATGLVKDAIPHGRPLGAWVLGGMTNVLHGEVPTKFRQWKSQESLIAVCGLVSRDLSSVPVATVHGTTIEIAVDGSTVTHTFGTPATIEDVVEELKSIPPLAGKVKLQNWRGGSYIVISSTDKLIMITSGSTSNTYFEWFHAETPTGTRSSAVISFHHTVKYTGLSDPITIDELDMFRTRVEVATESGTKTLLLYDRQDFLATAGGDDAGAWAYLADDEAPYPPSGIFEARLGYASSGTLRVYFKDPTFTKMYAPMPPFFAWRFYGLLGYPADVSRQFTYFTDVFGRRYFPDISFATSVVPSPDADKMFNNGGFDVGTGRFITHDDSYTGAINGRDPVVDFRKWGVTPLDILDVTTHPIVGTVDLVTFPFVAGKYLKISVGTDDTLVTVTFDWSVASIDDVIDQINQQAGVTIASKTVDSGTGAEYLVLEYDEKLVLISDGGADDATGDLFGPGFVGVETSNEEDSPVYVVEEISDDGSEVTLGFILHQFTFGTISAANVHFRISSPGCQGATPLQMKQDEFGFYYVDIEVLSEGFGDSWNLEDGEMLEVHRDQTLGWRTESELPSLTFSDREILWLVTSPKFVEPGAEVHPDNMIDIAGLTLVVTYTTSDVVAEVQSILSSNAYRVVTADLLAKHLQPVFVYLSIPYVGGSKPSVLETDIKDLIQSTPPSSTLTVQDLAEVFHRRGATLVQHPIEIVGMVWNQDRHVVLIHSDNSLDAGRRSILYPGVVKLVRS